MAVNLVAQVGREAAREILETSFAQFQADRAVVGLATKVRRNDEALAGYAESMHCHLGDFREYSTIRRELSDLEKKGAHRASVESRGERDRRQRQLQALRTRMKQHPCHACAEREAHARREAPKESMMRMTSAAPKKGSSAELRATGTDDVNPRITKFDGCTLRTKPVCGPIARA